MSVDAFDRPSPQQGSLSNSDSPTTTMASTGTRVCGGISSTSPTWTDSTATDVVGVVVDDAPLSSNSNVVRGTRPMQKILSLHS